MPFVKRKSKKKENPDLADSSMEAVSGAETRDDRSTRGARSKDRDSSPLLVTNGDTGFRGGGGETLPTDMSDTSDCEDKDKQTDVKCTSDHGGKLIMQKQFPFNIDQLFTMIFTNCKFNVELFSARRTRDLVQTPWQVTAGQKCRRVSYVLELTAAIGPKEVNVTETQMVNKCSKPGHLYSIDVCTENAGVPYADSFTVDVHYCLSRISEHVTDMSVLGHVKYRKSVWPMVKIFIEKNTIAGIEEYGRLIDARLNAEAEGQVPAARKTRRQRRANVASSETPAGTTKVSATANTAPRASLPCASPTNDANNWLAASVIVLLAINALLYWRLCHPPHEDDLLTRLNALGSPHMADWSALLDAHTKKQRGQMLAWREALDTTVVHLKEKEQVLRKLLETIGPSMAKADEPQQPNTRPDDVTDQRAHLPPT